MMSRGMCFSMIGGRVDKSGHVIEVESSLLFLDPFSDQPMTYHNSG